MKSLIKSPILYLWLGATYVVFRLYFKQIMDLDFRFWESDITTIASIGYVYLTWLLFTKLIK